MQPTNILIADRHFVSRLGLAVLLREILPSVRFHQVQSPAEVAAVLQQQQICLLICEAGMTGMGSLEFVNKWRDIRPTVKILVFTGYSEQRNLVRFLRSGVDGFLGKGSDQAEIQRAVLSVLHQGRFIGETAKDMIVKNAIAPPAEIPRDFLKRLSEKEKRLLGLLLKGNRSKEIAHELGLKASTVSHYKRRIFKKLEVASLVGLINKFESYQGY